MKFFVTVLAIVNVLIFSAIKPVQAETPLTEMPGGEYKLDLSHASIVWKVSHLDLSDYVGRFAKFDATLDLNPEALEESSVSVTIDPTSIKTEYPNAEEKDFDQELATSAQWFNAGEYPAIKFQSKSIEITGDNAGNITGDLTFLGVTKPVTLNATFNAAMVEHPFSKKPALGFSAIGMIKRSEWGMGAYVPNVGDEVEIMIEAEFGMEK